MERDGLAVSMPLPVREAAPALDEQAVLEEIERLDASLSGYRHDPQGSAEILREIADLHAGQRAWPRAIQASRRCVNALRNSADGNELGMALYLLAEAERAGGQHGDAQNDYVEAERTFSKLGERAAAGTCWLLIGECREQINRLGGALEAYRQAGAAFLACGGELGRAHALFRQAGLLLDQDRKTAKKLLEEARDLYVRCDLELNPNPGIRMADPPLPEEGTDLRSIEPWIMGKVCQRDRVELDSRPEPKTVEVEEEAAEAGEARGRSLLLGGGLLVAVMVVFAGLAFVTSGRVALRVGGAQVMAALLGGGAAGCVLFGLRVMQLNDRMVSIGAPFLAFALVFQMSTMLRRDGGPQVAMTSAATLAPADGRSASLAARLRESGDQAAARGSADEARMAYREALEVYRAAGDREGEAAMLVALAQMDVLLERHADARDLYRQAAVVYGALGDSDGELLAVRAMVVLDEQHGDSARMADSHQRALTLLRARQDSEGEIELLRRVVDLNRERGDLVAARQAAGRLVQVYEEAGNQAAVAVALETSASLAVEASDLQVARAELGRANQIYQSAGDQVGAARSWSALGDVSMAAAAPAEARVAYDQALRVYDGSGAADAAMDARLKLAGADVALGQFESAMATYLDSLENCRQRQRIDCQAMVYAGLGDLDEKRGRVDAARLSYAKAEELFSQAKDAARRGETLTKLAAVEARLGNADASVARSRDALSSVGEMAEPHQRAAALIRAGQAAEKLGQVEEARNAYDMALASYDTSKDVGGQIAATTLLQSLEAKRNPEQAKVHAARLMELRGAAAAESAAAVASQPSSL